LKLVQGSHEFMFPSRYSYFIFIYCCFIHQTRINVKGSKDQVPGLTSDVLIAPSILPWLALSQKLVA